MEYFYTLHILNVKQTPSSMKGPYLTVIKKHVDDPLNKWSNFKVMFLFQSMSR